MNLTVLTPSIPGREHMLAECVASVNAQTTPATAHLIRCSRPHGLAPLHLASQLNALLAAVQTDWVAVLADDDLWLPNFVAAVTPHTDTADVIYTWDDGHMQPRINCNGWSAQQIATHLDRANFIAAPAAIRTTALNRIGGWPTDWVGGSWRDGGHYKDSPAHAEDWELWRHLNHTHARFHCVPVEAWHGRTGHARITTTL